MLTLEHLKSGEEARITGFDAGDVTYRRQLMAMGLTPNTIIKVVRRAPMGDPIQIHVRNASLSLRKEEAALLQLERVS